jgi:predicted XRE-type DNA-binding protein
MSKRKFEVGTRNVFKDLGLPNAEEHLVKAQLVYKIDMMLNDRKLKQAEAGKLFGIPQPDVSKMLRGEFRQFSLRGCYAFW